MRTYLTIGVVFFASFCDAQSWQVVGPDDFKQISYTDTYFPNVYLDTLGNAFISYAQGLQGTTSRTLLIKQEAQTGWIQTTQVIAAGLYYSLIMDKSGNFYVADDTLVTGGYAIRLRKFNGTSWSLQAPIFSVNSSTRPYIHMKLDLLGNPTILYSDTGVSVFPKMVKWDGTNWLNIGGTIVNTTFNRFLFDFDSNNDVFVLLYDILSGGTIIRKFDGVNWTVSHNNVPSGSDFRIYKDTMYISGGTRGIWGGTYSSSPSSYITKFNGSNWQTVADISTFNGVNVPFIPLTPSTQMYFDATGTIYLSGGTIWKIQGNSISQFGAAGNLALNNDTFYTVDNSAVNAQKIRVIKKINDSLIEDYPVSVFPFTAGYLSTYALFYRQPNHSFFMGRDSVLNMFTYNANAISRYNGSWDSILLSTSSINRPIIPYTMTTDTSSTPYFMNIKLPTNLSSSNDLSLMKLSGRNWVAVGSSIALNSAYNYGSFTFDNNNTPFTAFVDITPFGSNRVRVKKYDGTNWVDVSASMPFISNGASENPLIVCDTANTLSVLYKEGGSLYMMKFDGTNWNAIGGVIDNATNIDYQVAVAENGQPVVLNLKPFNGKLKPIVKRYDGSNWITLGLPGFSYDAAIDPSLVVKMDSVYIAYTDTMLKKVLVAKFDGQNWGALGTTNISRDPSSHPNLVKSGNDIYLSYYSDGFFVKKNTSDTIIPLFQCISPFVTIAGVTDTYATASWTIPVQVVGYEYVLSTTNILPSGSGIFTTNYTYPAYGLQPNTTYYFFIRTICGIDTSAWGTTSFTTTNATHVTETFADNADIKIYPNPVTGILNMEQVSATKQHHFELYDLFGRTVRTISFSTPTIQVDLEGLSQGVYFLRSKAGEKRYSFKVVKQ